MASKIQADRGTTLTITGNVKEGTEVLDISGATVFFTVKSAEYTASDGKFLEVSCSTSDSGQFAPTIQGIAVPA